ncbi:MAG: hypothetical protein ACKVP6_14725 [Mycobacterium sp.]
MQISVRSYLSAGMTAVVGAGAIAMAPVGTMSDLSPAAPPVPVVAEVALAGVTLPFTDILSLLQALGIGGAIPDITSLVPADFANAIATEFLNQATPLVTTAAADLFAFFNSTVGGLLSGPDSIPARFGAALGAVPTVLGTVVQALSTGDVPAALQALSTGLVAPVTAVGQAIADAGQAFQSYVTAQISGLTNALPGLLLAAVSTVITSNVQSVLAAVQSAIAGLLGGLIPAAASTSAAVSAARVRVAVVAPDSVAAVPASASVAATDPGTDSSNVAEQAAPPVVPDLTVAPVTSRPRPVARRSVISGTAVSEAAAVAGPKQASRSHSVAKAAGSE